MKICIEEGKTIHGPVNPEQSVKVWINGTVIPRLSGRAGSVIAYLEGGG